MQADTISPLFVKQLLTGYILKGYDPLQLLKSQQISPQVLTNPKFRISTHAYAKLCDAIIYTLRDEAYGLLEKPQPLGVFHQITRACMTANTIKESLRIWSNGINFMGASISNSTHFSEEGGYLAVKAQNHRRVNHHYIVETALSSAHRIHCWLANEFIPIESVDLAHPTPWYDDEYRYMFYGATINFGQKINAIHFNKQALDLHCVRNKEELPEIFEHTHHYLLTKAKHSKSIGLRVRMWLENQFREGYANPQLSDAQEHFELNEQTLRRRLKKEGYSFQQLKDETRRDMAINLISRDEHSIEEIAFRLGFSEASTFIRAFKQWTGLTPLAYRKH